MIIDFINFALLLAFICFCITFFIVGDRFALFGIFLRMIMPFSIFGILFLIVFKIKRNEITNFERAGVLEEKIVYLSLADKKMDKVIISMLPFLIMLFTLIDMDASIIDVFQSVTAFLFMFFWHKFLFKKPDTSAEVIQLKNIDKIRDEIMVYLLPLIMAMVGFFTKNFNLAIDFLQCLSSFLVMISWHYIIFKQRD